MNVNKTLLTALGMTVAMAFSAPVLTANAANAAGEEGRGQEAGASQEGQEAQKHAAPAVTTKKTTM